MPHENYLINYEKKKISPYLGCKWAKNDYFRTGMEVNDSVLLLLSFLSIKLHILL